MPCALARDHPIRSSLASLAGYILAELQGPWDPLPSPRDESSPGAVQAAPQQGPCWFMPALSWDGSADPCSAMLQAGLPTLCKTELHLGDGQVSRSGVMLQGKECFQLSAGEAKQRRENRFCCWNPRPSGPEIRMWQHISSQLPETRQVLGCHSGTASLFNNSSEKAKQRQALGAAQWWEYVSSLWRAGLQRGPHSAASSAGKSCLENFGCLHFQ